MKWTIVAACCLLNCIAMSFLHSKLVEAAEPPVLKAGAVTVDITPEKLPVETAGSMTPHSTDKVHDRLFARCLVLDNGSSRLAMVVCDSCMIPRELFDAAKQTASAATGIPSSHILCSATHSHSAVCVTRVFQSSVDRNYSEFLQKKIAQAIQQAYQQLEPAKIGWAIGSNPQQIFNRRWFLRPGSVLNDPFESGKDKVRMNPPANHPSLLKPAGPTDPGVPVLSVRARDGRPIAIWTNYSLHYVGGIPEGGLSGDYFGEFAVQMSKLVGHVEGSPPMVAAMTNGTSADVNNINFFEGRPAQKPFEQIKAVAADLAKTVHTAYQRIEYVDWVPIGVVEEEIELGVRKPDEAELTRAKEILASAGPAPWKEVKQIYANETIHMAEYPSSVKAKLQAIRIGDVGIASTPCETFVETGLAIKTESPLPLTFTVELANGYNGYLPTPEQHRLGGYETWRAKSSYLTVDSEPKVRTTLLRMLETVAKEPVSISEAPKAKVNQVATDALSKIESTRGGRHWIDQPTALPRSPDESLACFQVEPGLRVELVAAEPLVYDPVWLSFDQYGRMFVAEYTDYPSGSSDGNPMSKIVMLLDTDGDGRMDQRHLFAEKLDFAHSFMPFRDGLLVGAKTEILYLRDTDGDHRADVREVVFRGFSPAHPQMQIGCPVWGMDNWIYWTYGAGDVQRLTMSLSSVASSEVIKTRRDFKFHPLTWEFGASSGFGQFGHTIDSIGNRFFCTNRNPIIAAPILPKDFQRNSQIQFSMDQYDVAPSGGDSLVFPLVEMKSNYLSHAGTHTAACGTTAYVGDLLGEQYRDNVLVCEPIGHLITRSIVESSGSTLKAKRARAKSEFLASTDSWFRPASLANGPDGAIYIADMYRLWVEHPKFLPPEIAAKIDWRAGEDKGRIWRIVPDRQDERATQFVPPQSTSELVRLLSDTNGWKRELAQRLLVERQSAETEVELRKLLASTDNPWAAQRALWTLDGLGKVGVDDLKQVIASSLPNVRKDGVRIARQFLNDASVQRLVLEAAKDSDARVRLECALALGDFPTAPDGLPITQKREYENTASKALAQIALSAANDEWLATAVLTSAKDKSAAVLTEFVSFSSDGSLTSSPVHVRVVRELSAATGARCDSVELTSLLKLIGGLESVGGKPENRGYAAWWKYLAIGGLADGLSRNRSTSGNARRSLVELLSNPPQGLNDYVAPVAKLLDDSKALAMDSKQTEVDRVAATELLLHLPKGELDEVLKSLFQPEQPVAIQLAAIRLMRKGVTPERTQLVFENWHKLGPLVRSESLSFLMQHKETTKLALRAMLNKRLSAAAINIDQRATLLAHPDSEIKQLASSVFGSGISQDRQEVASRYRSSLKLAGDAKAGRDIFDRTCAGCHRFDGRGHEVGPDITDTRNRSHEALLFDILDPNQKLEPKYTAYQALTVDGSLYQGLLVSETPESIVLQMAQGKQQSIPRADLELLQASGKSLMPEGIEEDLSIRQVADLLAFLKSHP